MRTDPIRQLVLKGALLLFLVLAGTAGRLTAQFEIPSEERIFYRNERTFAGILHSNGWGANFRYASRIDAFSNYLFDVDLGTIQHPKEVKSQSIYIGGWGRSFVFGKVNDVILLRAGAGYQRELFSKYDAGGISIRYFLSGGLSVSALKPIYYLKVTGYNPYTYKVERVRSPFDPDYMQSVYDIYDREPFYIGLGETRFVPGIYARSGLCFEYSIEDKEVNALEGGVQIEGFLKKLEILATENNHGLFVSLFVSYRFGKVLDARRTGGKERSRKPE
ncbi:MAG: hypothetical protein R6V75_09385 [Bacteroidales bacterium]